MYNARQLFKYNNIFMEHNPIKLTHIQTIIYLLVRGGGRGMVHEFLMFFWNFIKNADFFNFKRFST